MKLSFENRIPRWDEGLPLGNGILGALDGILGALVWGEADDFRISLNRADLWDLRRSDTFSSPKFNYREYVRLARAGKAGMGEFASLFDAPYNLPFPTRIPAAALRVLSDGDLGTGEFSLDVSRAEATVRTSSAEARVFTDAAEKYGRILVSGSCRVQLLPPSFAETAEKSEVVRHPLSSFLRSATRPANVSRKTAGNGSCRKFPAAALTPPSSAKRLPGTARNTFSTCAP